MWTEKEEEKLTNVEEQFAANEEGEENDGE